MFLIAKYSPGKFSFNLGVPDIYSTNEVTNKSSIASCLVNLRAVKTYSVNEVTDKNPFGGNIVFQGPGDLPKIDP